jgi:hypothetical protein
MEKMKNRGKMEDFDNPSSSVIDYYSLQLQNEM